MLFLLVHRSPHNHTNKPGRDSNVELEGARVASLEKCPRYCVLLVLDKFSEPVCACLKHCIPVSDARPHQAKYQPFWRSTDRSIPTYHCDSTKPYSLFLVACELILSFFHS